MKLILDLYNITVVVTENTKQFVVDDDSLYMWDMPSLKDYALKFNYTSKISLEKYMMANGHNVTQVWEQMDHEIVKVLIDNEKNVIKESRK